MPKMVRCGEILKNATFCVIFKHCVTASALPSYQLYCESPPWFSWPFFSKHNPTPVKSRFSLLWSWLWCAFISSSIFYFCGEFIRGKKDFCICGSAWLSYGWLWWFWKFSWILYRQVGKKQDWNLFQISFESFWNVFWMYSNLFESGSNLFESRLNQSLLNLFQPILNQVWIYWNHFWINLNHFWIDLNQSSYLNHCLIWLNHYWIELKSILIK